MEAMRAASAAMTRRMRVRVRGAVQGVGFRPFVYRLARRYQLAGFVANDGGGVVIEIEGARLNQFLAALDREAPPLARLDAIETEPVRARGDGGFVIARSVPGAVTARVLPDAATCEACLDELFDPASRFHRYPFVNCTQCGPRYTITRRLPYDRPHTAMAGFPMCAACARDYADPAARRFHAEAIACRECGPQLSHPVEEIVRRVRQGEIVALKSIGGFHLICDAGNEEAVARLRRRKQRDTKPFAVMVASPASLAAIAHASDAELELLQSRERPIVLTRSRGTLAPSLAPGLADVGVMLPYAPLHHLLFHAAIGAPAGRAWQSAPVDLVLVATSANPGGEPLVTDNAAAHRRLAGIADLIVTHDRPIVARADDSVMAIADGAPAFVRRGRGHVPQPIRLAREVPPVLAVGAHLKTTVTVTRGREAFVSPHIGDLDSGDAVRCLEETVAHLLSILDVEPVAVAHDLHPDFASTRFAEAFGCRLGCRAMAVQHHHAHAAAVAAEHHAGGAILGLVLDGFGLGSDGGNWGGELLVVDGAEFSRIGHLAPLPMPGGDLAAREPWRMAAAVLHQLGRADEIAPRFRHRPLAPALADLLAAGRAPTTTSAGRLFDAVAGLAGLRETQHHDGEAAMALEALVTAPQVMRDGWSVRAGVLDLTPLLRCLADRGMAAAAAADLFHGTLAAALAEWASAAARATGIASVALCGGCFLNRVLTGLLAPALRARGLAPLLARALPPNDGGLSLGQAFIAAGRLMAEGA
ncbi:MAG TPA: carbamoyltransferase HypF [Xanthobacteraceae bacterium]|nr:carbamoyltransferase HypF [Xanthobacteraceae bacterium]